MDRAATAGYGSEWSYGEECSASHHHATAGQGVVCNPHLPTVLSTRRSDGRIPIQQLLHRQSSESGRQGRSSSLVVCVWKAETSSDVIDQQRESTRSCEHITRGSDSATLLLRFSISLSRPVPPISFLPSDTTGPRSKTGQSRVLGSV
jgi:hypothetical protein